MVYLLSKLNSSSDPPTPESPTSKAWLTGLTALVPLGAGHIPTHEGGQA
jgi:hypothetical protein